MSFSEFFNAVKNAEFSFAGIGEWLTSIYYSITENPDIVSIWQFLTDAYNTYLIPLTLLFIAVGLVVAFYGQKITGIIKFLIFFVIGFSVGVHYLSPIIPDTVQIKSWIIGLVVAIVTAVLYKYLYYALIAVAVGYSVYLTCFAGFFIDATRIYTAGKATISLIVALVCVVIVLAFNKWAERALTATLGGYIVASSFSGGIFNLSSLFPNNEYLGTLIVAVVIAVIGFIFQFKKREVY